VLPKISLNRCVIGMTKNRIGQVRLQCRRVWSRRKLAKGHFHHAGLSDNDGLTHDQVGCSLLFSGVNGGLNLR